MLNILQSIFRPSSASKGPDDTLVRAATERLVDATDPRLRAASSYRKRLREPVVRTIEHVIGLVDAMPPPVEISTAEFSRDPRLRAFFVSAEHLLETVSYSEDLLKYLSTAPPSTADTIHCLLTLDRAEKRVLGMALHGDSVSRDVAQSVVNFSNHRLVGFAPSEDEMRWELKKRAFDALIQIALQALVERRDRTKALAQQQRLLQKKLDALHSGDWGVDALLDSSGKEPPDPQQLERALRDIEADLLALDTDTSSLDGQLENIAATLGNPEALLRLERTSLTLNSMGIRLEGAAAASTPPLELVELVSGQRRRVMLPGYVIRSELLPPRDFLKEVQRRLPGSR